jgi:hypothetical protein
MSHVRKFLQEHRVAPLHPWKHETKRAQKPTGNQRKPDNTRQDLSRKATFSTVRTAGQKANQGGRPTLPQSMNSINSMCCTDLAAIGWGRPSGSAPGATRELSGRSLLPGFLIGNDANPGAAMPGLTVSLIQGGRRSSPPADRLSPSGDPVRTHAGRSRITRVWLVAGVRKVGKAGLSSSKAGSSPAKNKV